MAITKINQVLDQAKNLGVKRLIAAWGVDHHTIEAIYEAQNQGFIKGILVGDKSLIEKSCNELKIAINQFEIIHADTEDKAAEFAVKQIHEGNAQILMKGLLSTDKYMRAILNKDWGLLPPKAVLTHIAVIENPAYHKLLIVSDVAIIPQPDLPQKIAMANYLIHTARKLGIEQPKMAVIAATEQVLPAMQACVDAGLLSKMADRGQIKGAIVDGPLSLDAALDKESAEIKGIKSLVAGDADCLLFPNIDAANVFYKMSTKLCKSEQGVVVAGAKVPCVLTSRGDSALTKLYSIAIAALLG